jgi:hypothetical protein
MKMPFITRPNSWVSQDAAATTQLTYGLQLNPAPLTVSLQGRDPVLGSLQFVLTNPTASPINLSSVDFTIQVGTASNNLTTSTETIGTSVSDPTDWQIQSPGTVTSGPATYTLQPQTGSSVSLAAGASVIVEIFDFPTILNPGNSNIAIKEVAGGIGFATFEVTTFPTGFYFNGLSATIQSGSQLLPIAQVGAGASIILVWNCSIVDLASIAIFYSNAAQGQQKAIPTVAGLWTSPALSADTIFTVVVMVSVAGGSPLTAALSTSVAVQNPALIAASITAGQATVSGPTLLNGTLGVTGNSNLGNLNAVNLGVSAATNLADTGVNGSLTVNGASSLAAATVNSSLAVLGLATLTGGLQLGGPLAALQTPVQIQPGSYGAAATDGFISGYTFYPYGQSLVPPVWYTISATSGNITQEAFAITIPLFDGHANYQGQIFQSGSFLLPVQKGNSFEISTNSTPNINPNIIFYWIPLGASATPEEMAALRMGDAQPPKQADPMFHEKKGRS